ncbi:hypothetical protein [uncultured Microbacterium sp.]|uniref:hypothetical protein n=2 Tax=uncultured Microbacterium sp. TaxID=191216 RepID=UPI0026085FC0|nr:hypothetical protein [uncultured Microbacterium sp.]
MSAARDVCTSSSRNESSMGATTRVMSARSAAADLGKYVIARTVAPLCLAAGALAEAYGLQADAFVPWAPSPSTTLLARVTDAASRAVDRDVVRTSDRCATLALTRATGAGPWALTYARAGRLITAFPVASAEAILGEWDADPDRPRWNAVRG